MSEKIENPVDFLLSAMADSGDVPTMDALTRLEHGLQCAANAERGGASAAMIVAGLLHDIGTIFRAQFPEMAGAPDRGHEVIGAEVLSRWFGPEVTGPIALHVLAKRHLVATEQGYGDALSVASIASLENQGPPLTPAESHAFLDHPFADDALALRRWDEDAKTPGAPTPSLEHFRPHLVSCLISD